MSGYSLHIGLNRVDPDAYGGWDGALLGCVNDANSMTGVATAENFSVTNQLLNEDATSIAIIGELNQMATNANAGDICLVTYSGHGGQVWDVNSDEEDAQDETWVAYDRQIVDDELFQMWSQFRPGVRIVVVSDSCHSGTVAKNILGQKTRQAMIEQVKSLPKDASYTIKVVSGKAKALPLTVQVQDNEKRRETYKFVQNLSGARAKSNIRAGVILLAGCQDSQFSFDGPTNGQFTGTLLQIWSNGSFQGDYASFHQSIKDSMPLDQVPNLDLINVDPAFANERPFSV